MLRPGSCSHYRLLLNQSPERERRGEANVDSTPSLTLRALKSQGFQFIQLAQGVVGIEDRRGQGLGQENGIGCAQAGEGSSPGAENAQPARQAEHLPAR